MVKNKYIVLDNFNYLAYFCRNLKNEYIPIPLNNRIKAFLETKGINPVGIFDYLSIEELKVVTEKAFVMADFLLAELDKENKQNYLEIFGTQEMQLMSITIGYLFKRFTMGSLRFLEGLEAILRKHNVGELAYLHSGQPKMICATKKERGFFFPDDITWQILKNWRYKGKPGLTFIKAPESKINCAVKNKNLKIKYLNLIRETKTFLSPFKQRLLNYKPEKKCYSSAKKNLLFLSPFYDLSFIPGSESLGKEYDVLTWNADDKFVPDGEFDKFSEKYRDYAGKFTFKAKDFDHDPFLSNIDFKALAIPLIKSFYQRKLPDIIRYWNRAEIIHKTHKIDMLFWGNPPHRYPGGITKEFFRINRVPICGMQHGGFYGYSNLDETLEIDFNNCDYYFSYGFLKDDLKVDCKFLDKPIIIPVGSSLIKRFAVNYINSSTLRRKKKVNILFPVALVNDQPFFESELTDPGIFDFQKKIIDIMAAFDHKKIILKFPIGKYARNSLGIYIEQNYPGKFTVIDHISFTKTLEEFEPEIILLEENSTPLNEALATKSKIIVYNNGNWCGLTEQAYELLSKRAVVCNHEASFLKKIQECLEGNIEKRDMENREFLEKYCIYKGDPEENIERAIRSLVSKGEVAREKTAYAN